MNDDSCSTTMSPAELACFEFYKSVKGAGTYFEGVYLDLYNAGQAIAAKLEPKKIDLSCFVGSNVFFDFYEDDKWVKKDFLYCFDKEVHCEPVPHCLFVVETERFAMPEGVEHWKEVHGDYTVFMITGLLDGYNWP